MAKLSSRNTSNKGDQHKRSPLITSSSNRLLTSHPPSSKTKQPASTSHLQNRSYDANSKIDENNNVLSNPSQHQINIGDTSSVPSFVTANKSGGLDATSAITSVDFVEHSVINSFTKYNVFPKLKFLIKVSEDPRMQWSTQPDSLCQYVLQGCNISFDSKTKLEHKQQQWYTIRKIVADKITSLRNDKSSSIRIAFYEYLDDRFQKDKKGPKDLSKFQLLRKDEKVHTIFVQRFVKPVVGVVEFNNRIKDKRRSAETLFTKTDEAFALLTLENNWDRWLDIFKTCDNRIPPVKRKRDGDEKVSLSNVRPKYTDGGISYSDESESSKSKAGKGWSETGLLWFNTILEMVRKSRNDHPNFLKDFVARERKKMAQNNQQNRRCSKTSRILVIPENDMFCEEGDNFPNDYVQELQDEEENFDEDDMNNEEDDDNQNYDDDDDDDSQTTKSSQVVEED